MAWSEGFSVQVMLKVPLALESTGGTCARAKPGRHFVAPQAPTAPTQITRLAAQRWRGSVEPCCWQVGHWQWRAVGLGTILARARVERYSSRPAFVCRACGCLPEHHLCPECMHPAVTRCLQGNCRCSWTVRAGLAVPPERRESHHPALPHPSKTHTVGAHKVSCVHGRPGGSLLGWGHLGGNRQQTGEQGDGTQHGCACRRPRHPAEVCCNGFWCREVGKLLCEAGRRRDGGLWMMSGKTHLVSNECSSLLAVGEGRGCY